MRLAVVQMSGKIRRLVRAARAARRPATRRGAGPGPDPSFAWGGCRGKPPAQQAWAKRCCGLLVRWKGATSTVAAQQRLKGATSTVAAQQRLKDAASTLAAQQRLKDATSTLLAQQRLKDAASTVAAQGRH